MDLIVVESSQNVPDSGPESDIVEPWPSIPRLFIHIPKTAGTSFRQSAIRHFGRARILSDYGAQAAETSAEIRALVLLPADPCGITAALKSSNAVMLSGHFNAGKYGGIFGLQDTVTFVRDPVDRVVSHYRHAVRDQGFEGSLLDFAGMNTSMNLQSRILEGFDPALIGIIGLTEQYRRSIDIVNARWGWNLEYREENISDQMSELRVSPSDAEKEIIGNLNARDRNLYERACHLFGNSQVCLQNGYPVEPRGAIISAKPGSGLNGWAFYLGSGEMAEVDVLLNGNPCERLKCAGFRAGIAGWKVPRNGYVGFISREIQLAPGDKVEIRDSRHGLLLDSAVVQ